MLSQTGSDRRAVGRGVRRFCRRYTHHARTTLSSSPRRASRSAPATGRSTSRSSPPKTSARARREPSPICSPSRRASSCTISSATTPPPRRSTCADSASPARRTRSSSSTAGASVDIDLSGVQWSAVPLSAIERIEIVRGGGSVLYGEGATAGVINIITRRPGAGSGAHAARRVGSYDTREGVVQGNVARGASASACSAAISNRDGYRRNNQNRQTNALADMRWSGAPGDLALKLGTDNQGIRLPGARQVQPSAGVNQLADRSPRRADAARLGAARRQPRALRLAARTFLSARSTSAAGWRDKTQRSYFDFGGFPDYREIELSRVVVHAARESDAPALRTRQHAGRRARLVLVGLRAPALELAREHPAAFQHDRCPAGDDRHVRARHARA